jgi:hydrogenase maturation factor
MFPTRGRCAATARLFASRDAHGDEIVLTKWAALEGSAILRKFLRASYRRFDSLLASARALSSGLSIVAECKSHRSGATAMHDVTVGGVLGAALAWLCKACAWK